MKICFLTHDTNVATGGGRFSASLISGVKNSGNDIVVLKEVGGEADGFVVLKRSKLGVLFSVFKSLKYVSSCDIIHALDIYPYGIIAWILSLILRKKFVLTLLGTYSLAPLHRSSTAWLSKIVCRNANMVTAISNFTKNEAESVIGLRNIIVINPGIDFNKFYSAHIQSTDKFILSVGALKPRKGYHISIQAFAIAKKQIPGLKYKIIADQDDLHYFEELKKIAERYGVLEDVEFIQKISDKELKDFYSKARLFILASINDGWNLEGFGIVFLEAAAAGVPVVGTVGSGATDAVNNGKNGILVPQNDAETTAQAIQRILSDSVVWNEMSVAGHEWAKKHEELLVTDKYLEIYNKL